jgi:hypothetical protein
MILIIRAVLIVAITGHNQCCCAQVGMWWYTRTMLSAFRILNVSIACRGLVIANGSESVSVAAHTPCYWPFLDPVLSETFS